MFRIETFDTIGNKGEIEVWKLYLQVYNLLNQVLTWNLQDLVILLHILSRATVLNEILRNKKNN